MSDHSKLDPLQQSMVGDFKKILFNSDVLSLAWSSMPQDQRTNVENHYLEWVWQTIIAATTAKDTEGMPQEDLQAYYKQFGGFVLTCQQGQPATFMTRDFVAMDRGQFDRIMERLKAEQ